MKEHLQPRPKIDERTPSSCVPFYMLTLRERQVLQGTADGKKATAIASDFKISVKTVQTHKGKIGMIGSPNVNLGSHIYNDYPHKMRITFVGLIQDGVANGYIKHKLPETPMRLLTEREKDVLDNVLNGRTRQEIADDFVVSVKTVEAHLANIHAKLGTNNDYHATARVAYLKVHGSWQEPTSGR